MNGNEKRVQFIDHGKDYPQHSTERLHVSILKKILSSEVNIPVWMFILFFANILISAWHLIDRAVEKETLVFLQNFIEEFELSFEFFHDATLAAVHYIPIKPVIILSINIILLFALMKFSEKMRKILQ